MQTITNLEQAVELHKLLEDPEQKVKIYCQGNAATPQVILTQFQDVIQSGNIKGDTEMYHVLMLEAPGFNLKPLFSQEATSVVTQKPIFCSGLSREAVNSGKAFYEIMPLSKIPRNLRDSIKPNVVFLQVAGPDAGGNYSLGTTVEGVLQAVKSAKEQGGVVIAELNTKMPYIIGKTIQTKHIDYLIPTNYCLPTSKPIVIDEAYARIGESIAELFIENGSCLQYGIGEAPEAVTQFAIKKGVKDLGIHTELFTDAMRQLHDKGCVSNIYKEHGNGFSVSTLFLSGTQEGYEWLQNNNSIQSRTSDYTNSHEIISHQKKMVAVNAAIGVDFHGNVWADSMLATRIYSGVGGQSDFIRGALDAEGGHAITVLRSTRLDKTTGKRVPKVVERSPPGITTTAAAHDNVTIVTEHGVVILNALSLGERAPAIAYLLGETPEREELMRIIYAPDSPYGRPKHPLLDGRYPRGFIPYKYAIGLEGHQMYDLLVNR